MNGGNDRLLAGIRVLIVEDEYFLAADLEQTLKSEGAVIVGPVGHLADAEAQVARDHFDFAVLDINLHDESAYTIADELANQHVPFLFATGYSKPALPERFAHVMLLEKPFENSEIVRHIRESVRSAKP